MMAREKQQAPCQSGARRYAKARQGQVSGTVAHVITKGRDNRVPCPAGAGDPHKMAWFEASSEAAEEKEIYSRGRRNSNPKTRTSPKTSCRRTLAMMGGVSLGTRLEEEAEGAGIVSWTI